MKTMFGGRASVAFPEGVPSRAAVTFPGAVAHPEKRTARQKNCRNRLISLIEIGKFPEFGGAVEPIHLRLEALNGC